MKKISATILLIAALVVPVALFLLLWQNFHLSGLIAAASAVTTGWALNFAWAFISQRSSLSIAGYFGWACPAVLVLLTWLAWRLVA